MGERLGVLPRRDAVRLVAEERPQVVLVQALDRVLGRRDDRDAVVADLELDRLDAVLRAQGGLVLVDRARGVGDVAAVDAEELREAVAGALLADDEAPVRVRRGEVLGDRERDRRDRG